MTRTSAFVLILSAVFGYSNGISAAGIETLTVKNQMVSDDVLLDGTVEAVQQATLFAQTSGRVMKLNFDVDDFVKKGSVVARLRDTEQKARLAQAVAGLAAAVAQHSEASAEYKRVADIFAKQLVSRAAMDKADAALKSARAQLDAARARKTEAEEQLSRTTIVAPYNGTVTRRHIEVGETLQVGQPIISGVAQQDALRFHTDIPQRLISQARKQKQVRIILDSGSELVSDEITIFPTADNSSRTFRLRAQVFSNQYHLYPGMFVKVAISKGINEQIVVPSSVIVQRSELTGVYIQRADGSIGFRQLRVGKKLASGDRVVMAGLSVGEKVITDPIKAVAMMKTRNRGE